MDEDTLIERLKEQVRIGTSPSDEYNIVKQYANPPVTMADLIAAEAKLGFALPPLLKRIYTEIGNGGFGPGYGFYKLYVERYTYVESTLVNDYLGLHQSHSEELDAIQGEKGTRDQPPVEYPEKVLEINEWGCNIYSYLDCSNREYRVLRKDHNYSLTEHVLEAPSFHQWLEDWLNGEPLFYRVYGENWKRAPKMVFF